jgi:hypothetical protein
MPQLGDADRGCIVRLPGPQGGHCGVHNVLGGVEIGLADLQVDDLSTLRFEGASPGQNLEGRLGTESTHPSCQAHGFLLCEFCAGPHCPALH